MAKHVAAMWKIPQISCPAALVTTAPAAFY